MSYTELMARLNLLPKEVAAEFSRWGHPQPEGAASNETAEVVVTALRERIEGEEATDIRQTDLDVLHQYMDSRQTGRLHLVIKGLTGEEVSSGDLKIVFGKTPRGEYIIPWNHDSIEEYLVDHDTYLQDGRRRVRFKTTRELWYGESKAFVVATPEDTDDVEG